MVEPFDTSTYCLLSQDSTSLPLSFIGVKVLAFIFHRTQSHRFYLSQDSKSSPLSFTGLKVLTFIFYRTQSPCFYLSWDSKSLPLSFIGLKVLTFIFHRTQSPLSLCFHRTQSTRSFTFQRLQCLQSFMLSKHYNVFIYISKTSMSLVIYAFKRLQCLQLHFNHLCFQNTRMSSLTLQRLQCLQSFTLSKDYNVFIYISKTSIYSVIYAFKRLQCLHLHFKVFNVFSHLRFQKTTMSSFTFQRLQYLQSFTLSKDYNVFIYIPKNSMYSVIYAFKRLQCLHLHFKDFNVLSHLCFQRLQCLYLHYKISMFSVCYILQEFNIFGLLHFITLQRLVSFIELNVLIFVLVRTQCPLFLCFEKKTSNVLWSIGL